MAIEEECDLDGSLSAIRVISLCGSVQDARKTASPRVKSLCIASGSDPASSTSTVSAQAALRIVSETFEIALASYHDL